MQVGVTGKLMKSTEGSVTMARGEGSHDVADARIARFPSYKSLLDVGRGKSLEDELFILLLMGDNSSEDRAGRSVVRKITKEESIGITRGDIVRKQRRNAKTE